LTEKEVRNVQRKKQRVIALLFSIGILFVLFVSITFCVQESNHDCTGSDCAICVCIHQAKQTVQELGTAIPTAIASAGMVWVVLLVQQLHVLTFLKNSTLISQKVRLND